MKRPQNDGKSTPGPWVGFQDDGQLAAIMPAGRPGDVCQFAVPPTDADGSLMLAAPDLLAFARWVRATVGDECEAQRRADRVIAKAEGAKLAF